MNRRQGTSGQKSTRTKRTLPYTVRLPVEVAEHVEQEAQKTGLTVSDVLTLSLQRALKLPQDPTMSLLSELAEWVSATYPPDDFPEHLILVASQHIRDTPRLRKLFDAAIHSADGEIDKAARKLLLQKMGRCVKRAVKGEVYARSLMLPSSNELIASYSLLRPSTTSAEESGPPAGRSAQDSRQREQS